MHLENVEFVPVRCWAEIERITVQATPPAVTEIMGARSIIDSVESPLAQSCLSYIIGISVLA